MSSERYLAGYRKGHRITREKAPYFSSVVFVSLTRHAADKGGRMYWCTCGGSFRVGAEVHHPGRPIPSPFRAGKGRQRFRGKNWRLDHRGGSSELGAGRSMFRSASSRVASRR